MRVEGVRWRKVRQRTVSFNIETVHFHEIVADKQQSGVNSRQCRCQREVGLMQASDSEREGTTYEKIKDLHLKDKARI